jgi:hypothetical protein
LDGKPILKSGPGVIDHLRGPLGEGLCRSIERSQHVLSKLTRGGGLEKLNAEGDEDRLEPPFAGGNVGF